MTVRAYDSKLTLPIRTLLRRAIVDEIRTRLMASATNPLGFLHAAEALPAMIVDENDEFGIDEAYTQLNGRVPSCGVALSRMEATTTGMGGTTYNGEIEIDVYWFSQNTRGFVVGRLEPDAVSLANFAADPGIDVMLELGSNYLSGWRPAGPLGTRCAQLRFVREWPIVQEAKWSVWGQRYRAMLSRDVNPKRDLAAYMIELHAIHRSTADADPTRKLIETIKPR